jgi:hypothetical protein
MKIEFKQMKYYLMLFFVLVYSSNLNAQNNLNRITGLSNTPASIAFSLRQLSTSYNGPLVRIYVGSYFYDVYPEASTKNFSLNSKISASISTYNAAVSVASSNALSSIITSGTTNATVAIWYDQSGNGVNVLTSSTTTGPKIITSGNILLMNGIPTINFFGAQISPASSPLISATTVNYSTQQAATVNAVVQNLGSTSNISGIYSTGLSGGWGLNYDQTNGYWIDGNGCNQAKSGAPSTTAKIVTGFMNKSDNTSSIYENSVQKGTKTISCQITNGTADKICIGLRAENGGTRKFDGNISEVILFPSLLSTSDQGALETNQNTIYFSPSVTITSSALGAVCAGTNITFTANAYNFTSTPTYQWYKNSIAINGATSSTYSTTTLTNNDVINVSCGNANTIVSDNTLSLWLDAGSASNVSGTTWTDLSGKGNHATFNSHQTYTSTNGGYFQFDGTSNPVLINKVTSAITEVTMSTWVYITTGTTQGSFIKNGAGLGYTFGAGGGGGFCPNSFPGMLLAGQGWLGSNSPTSNFTTGWQLCTMVITGSSPTTYKYYINGILANTATFSSPSAPNGSYTALGDNYGDNGGCTPFNSKMGAAYIYTKALSQTEIIQNYNASAARFGLSSTNSITSDSITSTINALPITPIITTNGDACVNKTSLTTPSGLTSYAWYKDNIAISSAITNSYIPTSSGAYQVTVSNGTCSSTSIATIIYTCGNNADGKAVPTTNAVSIISNEGGANFGTGKDISGKLFNTTGITSIFGTIGSSTAVIGGVISPTNIITTSIGAIYSTDVNFGTYSTTTIQSNVAAGSYSSNISGLNPLTTYFAKSFIVNKAGTSYGPVVSFATLSPPPVLGGSYGGGTVVHIFKNGDPGYVIGETHGIIMSNEFLNNSQPTVWTSEATTIATNATGTVLGSGLTNSNSIYNLIGNAAIAINLCRNYSVTISGTTYTNWYLPSIGEWNQVFTNFYNGLLPNFNPNSDSRVSNAQYAWTSSEVSASDVTLINIQNAGSFPIIKKWIGGTGLVRAIRYF